MQFRSLYKKRFNLILCGRFWKITYELTYPSHKNTLINTSGGLQDWQRGISSANTKNGSQQITNAPEISYNNFQTSLQTMHFNDFILFNTRHNRQSFCCFFLSF